jgi:hypothetical protein
MRPRLIGIAGRLGSGKTLAADTLCVNHNFVKVKFAKPIKDMMRTLGLDDRHIEGHLKEEPCDLLDGETPRWAMQSLGTDWGRSLISENLWLNRWRKIVEENLNLNNNVVVDDMRFPNEYEMVKTLSGQVIVLTRNAEKEGGHSSEGLDLTSLNSDLVLDNQDWGERKLTQAITSWWISSSLS